MLLKVKKLSDKAVTPSYAKPGDKGLDLTATSVNYESDLYVEYGTDIAVEIPPDYVGLIFPRSSVTNQELMLKNAVGVIDSQYRGEIKFRFQRLNGIRSKIYEVGMRVGQLILVPAPTIEVMVTDSLSETERGEGGYGSSGK